VDLRIESLLWARNSGSSQFTSKYYMRLLVVRCVKKPRIVLSSHIINSGSQLYIAESTNEIFPGLFIMYEVDVPD